LIPHHAIKRDVIAAAYEKDFRVAIGQVKSMNWVEEEKARRISEMRVDFEKHSFGDKNGLKGNRAGYSIEESDLRHC